ncbi:MAG: hypothetical protein EXS63_08345 [Candidatus Omnitrophica bacterium]|nr:hypothetical protein [Candidatus Omnitrophota bacterium]
MNFEKDDLELNEFFGRVALRTLPKSMLDSFEVELFRKIRHGSGISVSMLLGIGAVVLGVTAASWMLLSHSEEELPSTARTTVVSEQQRKVIARSPVRGDVAISHKKTEIASPSAGDDKATSEFTETHKFASNKGAEPQEKSIVSTVSKDLLLLQMLGEDEGIGEDLGLLDSDMEFIVKSMAVSNPV